MLPRKLAQARPPRVKIRQIFLVQSWFRMSSSTAFWRASRRSLERSFEISATHEKAPPRPNSPPIAANQSMYRSSHHHATTPKLKMRTKLAKHTFKQNIDQT